MTEVTQALTAAESAALAGCEETIQRGLKTFTEVGEALARVRDGRLYRSAHATFEDYCRERWALSARHANRMIEAARVAEILGPIGPVPSNEAQARELVPLLDDPERLRETWQRALDLSAEKPTAADIAAVRGVPADDDEPGESRRRAEEVTARVRAALHEGDREILVALMQGVPPVQVAGVLTAECRRFEREAHLGENAVRAVREALFNRRIDAVLAWPGGPIAGEILAGQDELSEIYSSRYLTGVRR